MELTPKQREVVKHLRAGARPADVAEAMGIARSTLRMHLHGIRKFYGTASYEQAIQKANRRGDL